MKKKLFCLLAVFSFDAFALKDHELERINFFPRSKSYAQATYNYFHTSIDTPESSVMTSEVNDSVNRFSTSYAYAFFPKTFIGVTGIYEFATESAVSYGLPLANKFSSQGFKELETFFKWRLREQGEDYGLWDLTLNFAPRVYGREVGKSSGNRLNGRNIVSAMISNGKKEGQWEFRTALRLDYFDEGEEHNDFSQKTYDLTSHAAFNFSFQGQYEVSDWFLVNASVGLLYRGDQRIDDRKGDKRELQAGTGSVFELGLKKPLSNWNVIEARYGVLRNDYFVKGTTSNFDGEETLQTATVTFTQAF